jgi:hypothetical protein
MVLLEGLVHWKKSMTTSGVESATLQPVAQCPQRSMLQLILQLINTTINKKLSIVYTNSNKCIYCRACFPK